MLSPELIAAVKHFEGFEPWAKWDYKQWTNGFGTKALHPREHITETVANDRLIAELTKAAESVERFAPGLPQGPKDAMTDFTFNAGSAWEHEPLGAAVKAHNWAMARAHLLVYDHAGGKVLKALEERRAKEASWFSRSEAPVVGHADLPAPVAAAAAPTPATEPVEKPKAPEATVDPYGPVPAPKGSLDPTTGGSLLSQILHSVEAVL